MKTKIIPFDLETAKKIQAGEIEGRIVQNNGLPAAILAFDINGENLVIRFMRKDGTEGVSEYQPNGKVLAEWCNGSEEFDLVIELPEKASKHKFKPFDKVLVRDVDGSKWCCDFFSHFNDALDYECIGGTWCQCIPYEGNEHLVGTTDKPKEELVC